MFGINIDWSLHTLRVYWEPMEQDIHNQVHMSMVHYMNDMVMYYMYDHKHYYNYPSLDHSCIQLLLDWLEFESNDYRFVLCFALLTTFSGVTRFDLFIRTLACQLLLAFTCIIVTCSMTYSFTSITSFTTFSPWTPFRPFRFLLYLNRNFSHTLIGKFIFTYLIHNIEDYSPWFLPNDPYISVVMIDKLSIVFGCQDHMFSNMDSI